MIPENFDPLESQPLIQKSIIHKSSEVDPSIPKPGNKVKILYKCRLSDYSVVDENENKESPFTFTVAEPGVIEGLQIGIQTMQEGERAVFKIPPQFAYGENGSGKIPKNEILYFEAELLNTNKKKKKLTWDQKIKKSDEFKELGTKQYLNNNLKEALKQYKEALKNLSSESSDSSEDEEDKKLRKEDKKDEEKIKTMKINLHNNKTLLFIKQNEYSEALKETKITLKLDEKNVKALLRKGKVLSEQQKFEKAYKIYQKALEILPNDKEILQEFKNAKNLEKKYLQKEKNLYSKMFKAELYKQPCTDENDPENPKVWLDISIGENEKERISFQLFKNVVPRTVDNFIRLCKGEVKGEKKLSYIGNKFHRLIKGFMLQGGDITKGDGTGGMSVYGDRFDDENFALKHRGRGYLSMANAGPNMNGSQFFILFDKAPHLDGRHVVFGKVYENIELLEKFEKIPTGENEVPSVDIKIVDAGVYQQII